MLSPGESGAYQIDVKLGTPLGKGCWAPLIAETLERQEQTGKQTQKLCSV